MATVLARYRFEALGTTALVVVTDPSRLREAGALLHDELAIEAGCKIHRLSQLCAVVNLRDPHRRP